MKKKGSAIPVAVVVDIVIGMAAIMLFFFLTSNANNPELIDEIVTAEDLARTFEVAQGVAYDFHYTYPETVENHYVKLEGNVISLEKQDGTAFENETFLKKRTFPVIKDLILPKNQKVNTRYFFIEKKGNDLRLGDSLSDDNEETFVVTKKEKPNITLIYEKPITVAHDKILDELVVGVKSNLEREFDIDNSQELIIRFKIISKESHAGSLIYYSKLGSEDTKKIAKNLETIISEKLSLKIVPLAKNFGQEKVIELNILDDDDSLKIIRDDSQRRLFSQLISQALIQYYGVGN